MEEFLSILSMLGQGIGALYNNKQQKENQEYTRAMNQRDFDYQQALQQQIFEREDTAVQRRMQDLEAAGLNPNLAAGSAAGAGAVVGRSNTQQTSAPQFELGSMMDAIAAAQQIKAQKQQTANAKIEQQILKNQQAQASYNAKMAELETMFQLGVMPGMNISVNKNGELELNTYYPEKNINLNKSPYFHQFKNFVDQVSDEAAIINLQRDILNKDLQWYTADKLLDYGFKTLGLGIDTFGTFSKFKKFNK